MRVLVACEYSGTVRDAFRAMGHDAWSCDLLPTEVDGPHIVGDVLSVLGDGWDLMIAHPPCTHLAVSGARWFPEKRKDGRQKSGIDLFMALANANIPRIAIENPVGIMSTVFREPDQVLQPWMFGHPEFKATCLWLKGLAPLRPTDVLQVPEVGTDEWKKWNRVHKCPPGPERAKLRSWRYPKIAAAMADQWSRAACVKPFFFYEGLELAF